MLRSLLPTLLFLCMQATLLPEEAALETVEREPALKDVCGGYFEIGTALTYDVLRRDPATCDLIRHHFNSITPQDELKWDSVHIRLGIYAFRKADAILRFARDAGMSRIGHVLIWHQQIPDWVEYRSTGRQCSSRDLLERMQQHIYRVAGKYRGDISHWDVINEAFHDNGNYRNTFWFRIIGPEYLEYAFRYAMEAAPGTKLYYNDFSIIQPGRRAAVIQLVRDLRSKGIRIDGVGMQGHWELNWPSVDELEATLNLFREEGIQVCITEMDISVLPRAWNQPGADLSLNYELKAELDPYAEGLPPEVDEALAKRYGELFRLFRRHADIIDRVTLWGATDACSWRNDWPVNGRSDYPLLFDRNRRPKAAYYAVIEAMTECLDNDDTAGTEPHDDGGNIAEDPVRNTDNEAEAGNKDEGQEDNQTPL